MNIIKFFNQTIDYIETTLEDKIDEKKIVQLSGYSYPMFSRIFSILSRRPAGVGPGRGRARGPVPLPVHPGGPRARRRPGRAGGQRSQVPDRPARRR